MPLLIVAGLVVLVFSPVASVPAALGQLVGTATPLPANYARIVKTGPYQNGVLVTNNSVLGPVLRGTEVEFRLDITLGGPRENVQVEDIFSGGGRSPDTDYVPNSAVLLVNGVATPIDEPDLTINQFNRVIRLFDLGDLPAGNHTLTYRWLTNEDLPCFVDVGNEAHLRIEGQGPHLSTSTIHFGVRGPQEICLPPTQTPTRTPLDFTRTPVPTETQTPTRTPLDFTRTPVPTETLTPTRTATVTATVPTEIQKGCVPTNPLVGQELNCTVTFSLNNTTTGVVIEDIISGPGIQHPGTQLKAGSSTLASHGGAPVPIADPDFQPSQSGPGRIIYHYDLDNLTGGTYTLRYTLTFPSNLKCFTSVANEVHLRRAGTFQQLDTSTVHFMFRCA
jgi:hypothetical protein